MTQILPEVIAAVARSLDALRIASAPEQVDRSMIEFAQLGDFLEDFSVYRERGGTAGWFAPKRGDPAVEGYIQSLATFCRSNPLPERQSFHLRVCPAAVVMCRRDRAAGTARYVPYRRASGSPLSEWDPYGHLARTLSRYLSEEDEIVISADDGVLLCLTAHERLRMAEVSRRVRRHPGYQAAKRFTLQRVVARRNGDLALIANEHPHHTALLAVAEAEK